jgi:hypothetical protein
MLLPDANVLDYERFAGLAWRHPLVEHYVA